MHPEVEKFLVTVFQQVRNLEGKEPHYGGLPHPDAGDPALDQDAGIQRILEADGQAEFCRYRDRAGIAHALSALVRVFSPSEGAFAGRSQGTTIGNITDATNPFNDATTAGGIVLPANILQAIEVIGFCEVGHQGFSLRKAFNVPLGQAIIIPAVGSAMAVSGRFASRYTPKLGAAGGPYAWLVGPTGSHFDRNNAFNNPPGLSAFGAANPTPVMLQGFVGKGFSSPVPAQRIFFGWVDPAELANTQHFCPVAPGAQTVFLSCDVTNANNDPAGTAPFQGVRLQFNQICQSPGVVTRRVLNCPSNTTVPLRADCVAIEVVNIDVPPAATGVPFELQYDLGF